MFVQRDIIIRQIEQATAGLARLVAGQPAAEQLDEAEVGRAAGLGLDIARSLPTDAIAGLVDGDPDRLLLLGLALGRIAWRDGDRATARRALGLLDRALADRPPDPELLAAQAALLALAFD